MSEYENEVPVEVPAEVNETDLAIKQAFEDNIDKSDEEVKMAMLMAGAKFKNVTRLYNEFAADAGLIATKEDRANALTAIAEQFDLSEEGDFDEAVTQIVETVAGTTDTSAAIMIRNFCKKEGLDVWRRPKGASRSSGFRFKFYDALRSNPRMTAEEAASFGDMYGSNNDKKAFSHYQAIRELVNSVAQ